nr:SDR family oxidoreductase [Chelatococcus sp. HY11]
MVFGGSGGLGSAICTRLTEEWKSLVLTYHGNAEKAASIRADLANKIEADAVRADIRSDSDVQAAIDKADAMNSGLKGVIFASGANILQPFVSQIDQKQWDDVISIELLGFTRVIRLTLPVLRKNGGGAYVSVVSFGTYWFPPGDAISAVPKAGIEMLTRAVAKEEGRYGIRANSVAPGIINAGLGSVMQDKVYNAKIWEDQKKRVPLRRFGEASDIAEAVGFCASPRSSYITGQTIIVDGGLRL